MIDATTRSHLPTDLEAGDVLTMVGGAVRALDAGDGDDPETLRVGGYLVPFTDANNKDYYDTYWTDESYLGAQRGNGQDCLVHHMKPLGKDTRLVELSERRLTPLTTRVDPGIGLWAETVLNLRDEYEAAVAEMVRAGKLAWSSGSAPHVVRINEDGWVRCWPIIEGSLTPTPGTPENRTGVTTIRALVTGAITERAAAPAGEEPAGGAGDAGTGDGSSTTDDAQGSAQDAGDASDTGTRAVLLGKYLEQDMMVGAIERVYYALWYVVYDTIYPYATADADNLEERLATLEAAIGEFGTLIVGTIRNLAQLKAAMDAASASTEDAAAQDDPLRAGLRDVIDLTTAARALMRDPELRAAAAAHVGDATRVAKVLAAKHETSLTEARDLIQSVLDANDAKKVTVDEGSEETRAAEEPAQQDGDAQAEGSQDEGTQESAQPEVPVVRFTAADLLKGLAG
jgi:hypothetical protein